MAKKRASEPASDTLLIELLTEELPPKALVALGSRFTQEVFLGLSQLRFVSPEYTAELPKHMFATPRRLAVLFPSVRAVQEDSESIHKGPYVTAGQGAIEKFAAKWGLPISAVETHNDSKGTFVVARRTKKGELLNYHLAEIVSKAIQRLPAPKIMRWGLGDAEFVRPVHGLVMMHGSRVIPGEVFGLKSTNSTLGHRFLSTKPITLKHADDYERMLSTKGGVVASFIARRNEITKKLAKAAGRMEIPVANDALLDEIAALVEAPTVHAGEFSAEFLALPEECLILSMQQHQKYVPLRDKDSGRLLPRFLFVSNVAAKDPKEIIHGNERVLRARLSDAKFFFDQDRKTRLEARVPRLANVVYHSKLGSQLQRVERIQLLAGMIAREIGTDALLAERAAWLSKADLLTDMVGEFPELQGIMGSYYARNDGEPEPVVRALADQYILRRSEEQENPEDPEILVSACLYLSDRIEALVGIFGVGNAPTGEKDPFGLRRAALGVISVYNLVSASTKIDKRTIPDVKELVEHAVTLFPTQTLQSDTASAVYDFILDRYWHQLAIIYAKDLVEAVISQKPHLTEIYRRVQAVESFRKLPEAESLAAANKRIRNILRKSEAVDGQLDETLLTEPAERSLHSSLTQVEPLIANSMRQGDYTAALKALAGLRTSVDTFFDKVLVNAEDPRLRANRHALLRQLDALMNRVADISKLAA